MKRVDFTYEIQGSFLIDREEEKIIKEKYNGDIKAFINDRVDVMTTSWEGELLEAQVQ